MAVLLEFYQGLSCELFRAGGFEFVVSDGDEVGPGFFSVAKGLVGTTAIVENVGVIRREGQGGVVGFESFISTAEEQEGITTAVQGFGGKGDLAGVIRGQAVAQGLEDEFAGAGGGFDFGRCGGGFLEVFLHLIQQRFEGLRGVVARAFGL